LPGAINNRDAAVQLRFVPLFPTSPSYRHHHSQTSISRHNILRCLARDEDEVEGGGSEGGRRVKGLYKLIRAEGVMIEDIDRWKLPFSAFLWRNEIATIMLLFGRKIKWRRSIDLIHSMSLLLVYRIDTLFIKYKYALSSTYKLHVLHGIFQKKLMINDHILV